MHIGAPSGWRRYDDCGADWHPIQPLTWDPWLISALCRRPRTDVPYSWVLLVRPTVQSRRPHLPRHVPTICRSDPSRRAKVAVIR